MPPACSKNARRYHKSSKHSRWGTARRSFGIAGPRYATDVVTEPPLNSFRWCFHFAFPEPLLMAPLFMPEGFDLLPSYGRPVAAPPDLAGRARAKRLIREGANREALLHPPSQRPVRPLVGIG
jgi:hypothetical protein